MWKKYWGFLSSYIIKHLKWIYIYIWIILTFLLLFLLLFLFSTLSTLCYKWTWNTLLICFYFLSFLSYVFQNTSIALQNTKYYRQTSVYIWENKSRWCISCVTDACLNLVSISDRDNIYCWSCYICSYSILQEVNKNKQCLIRDHDITSYK